MADLEFRILGPLDVTEAGASRHLGPPGQRALLVALVLSVNEVVSTDRLIDLLWGEHPPTSAANLVQGYVSGLRKVLEPGRRAREAARMIRSEPPGYMLGIDPKRIDAVQFEQLVQEGRRVLAAQPARASAALKEALSLWRGPALESFDFATAEAARLEELRLGATEDLFDAELRVGSHRALIPQVEAFVAEHPLRERARAQLITALYRSGRQAEALESLAETRTLLREELGLDPGPELQQLETAILRQEPALATHEIARTNVPLFASSFVGRDGEQEEIMRLLSTERLVTLAGAGGCGKTRLALTSAEEAGRRFADGVWFVDLAPIEDPALVIQAIAMPFGLRRETDEALAEALSVFLRAKSMLLIVDNCEHVVGTLAPAIGSLLETAPGVVILATSREPLGIDDEIVFRVPPLGTPDEAEADPVEIRRFDAVRLFAARATLVSPGFRVDGQTAREVARICRALEGMPLAIELAASLAGVLSLSQIGDRIDDFPDLLDTGDAAMPARQRTIGATIRWSYDLLTAPERALLNRLCTFAGGFTLEGAEAIASSAEESRHLTRLVTKSMVSEPRMDEVPPRHRILGAVREFGLRELLSSGEIDAVRERHSRYLLDIVEKAGRGFRGAGSPHALDGIERDMDDIHLALRWSFGRGDEQIGIRLVATLW